MKLRILRADPAGNITLFVLDPVPDGQRAELAGRLMLELPELNVEQVAFVCPAEAGGDGRMVMMGGEFCGNATRAFGLMTARQMGNARQVCIETSGCDHPVRVDVDPENGTAQAEMPLPRLVQPETAGGHDGTLVHLGGIAHLVVEDVQPSPQFFELAESVFARFPELDAYGVIFLDSKTGCLTPLVKVCATDTLVWEGSCGSGSLAAAVAQSIGCEGVFEREYTQPAGLIRATVRRENGVVVAAAIGGPVLLDEPMEVELR